MFKYLNDKTITKITKTQEFDYLNKYTVLNKMGYTSTEINCIFEYLNIDDINKLTKINKINDLNNYIIIKNFNIENIDRYIEYKTKFNYQYDKTILYVNMNLDQPFYTNYIEALDYSNINALINKYRYLPADYIPNDLEKLSSYCGNSYMRLRKVARKSFEELCIDAKSIGYNIFAVSTYRNYSYQNDLFNYYIKKDNIEKAETYSARPGFSEHQTGLAVDISRDYNINFELSDEFIWLKDNAHLYGFILRYPKGKENETGYIFEPWHYRYVGEDIASFVYNNNLTYDEYYFKYIEN